MDSKPSKPQPQPVETAQPVEPQPQPVETAQPVEKIGNGVTFVLAPFETFYRMNVRRETLVLASADGRANRAAFKCSPVSIRTAPTGPALKRWTWPKSSGTVLGIISTHVPHVLATIGQYESDPSVTVSYYVSGTGPTDLDSFVTAFGAFVESLTARTVADRT